MSSIPTSQKAYAATAPNEASITTIPVPVPDPDEILIRNRAVSQNPVDAKLFYDDHYRAWVPHYPFIMGTDIAGEVVKVGANVTEFKEGDLVGCNELMRLHLDVWNRFALSLHS
jgi:NADPH:quinone reductase-like Zn-dependent oxidoreductase